MLTNFDAHVLSRSVVEVYTRATVPLPEPTHEREQQDDAETDTEYENPTRFILCLVEETIHHKTLFTRKVHELPDESRKHVDEVRVGIFAHDVHTGESLYEEFQDGKPLSMPVNVYPFPRASFLSLSQF